MKALCIAFTDYAGTGTPNLPRAADDARRMAGFLKAQGHTVEIFVDRPPTFPPLEHSDADLVYVASHGEPGHVLFGTEAIPIAELGTMRRITIIDACYTGQAVTTRLDDGSVSTLASAHWPLGLFWCASLGPTYEDAATGGSVFCRQVIEAITQEPRSSIVAGMLRLSVVRKVRNALHAWCRANAVMSTQEPILGYLTKQNPKEF